MVPGSQTLAQGGFQAGAEAPSGDGKVWRPEGGSEALAQRVGIRAFCPPGAGVLSRGTSPPGESPG